MADMATLVNHPGYWMRDDAAASLARWEADHGVIPISSAGRYEWEQQALIDRWNRGGTYNRPPYLYSPKRPASASEHVKNGGEALDVIEHNRFRARCADYGWWQPYTWDVVHFVYDPRRDKHRNRSAGGNAKPIELPEEEEDDMKPFLIWKRNPNGTRQWALISGDLSRMVPIWKLDTANSLGKQYGAATEVVQNEWDGFVRSSVVEVQLIEATEL